MICTFCSGKSQIVFSHLTHDIGQLCIDCYLKLQGSCGVCSTPLIPADMKHDVTYDFQAKFIGMGEKSILVCDSCHAAIRKEFPQMFGRG